MTTTPLISLLDSGDREVLQQIRYFQAEVTGYELTTGRVSIKQIDNEDDLPDDEAYPSVYPFRPQVGDWVMMASWNRSAVCLGPIIRDAAPAYYYLPSGQSISYGNGSPEGFFTAPVGSIHLRSDGASGTTVYTKISGSGNTGWEALAAAGSSSGSEWQRAMVTKSLIVDTQTTVPLEIGLTGYAGVADVFDDQLDTNSPGAWLLHNTSAVTDNDAGWSLTDAFRTNWFPARLTFRFQTGATLTSLRFHVGAYSSTPMASAGPAVHGCGFRYDTGSDLTAFWRTWTNDGSGSGSTQTTTVAVSSQTDYTLEIEIVSTTEIKFYINGVLHATHTSDLPGATTTLFPRCMVRTLTTSVRSVRWSWFHMQHS